MGSRWNVSYDENKEGTAGYVTSREPQKDYAALMRASLEAARSVDDTIRICGFSTSDWEGNDNGMTPGVEWTSGVLKHDGLKWCDLIDYHHYSSTVNGFPGDDVEKAWQRAIGPIVKKLSQSRRIHHSSRRRCICHGRLRKPPATGQYVLRNACLPLNARRSPDHRKAAGRNG